MTTDITELAQRLKAAAEKATPGTWGIEDTFGLCVTSDFSGLSAICDVRKKNDAVYISVTNPPNVLALLEALEKAQRANAAQDDHINQQQDRIESLEKKNAELGKYAGVLESRTVKLPKCSVGEVMHMSGFSRDYAEGWCAGNDNAIHEIHNSGIKVEG